MSMDCGSGSTDHSTGHARLGIVHPSSTTSYTSSLNLAANQLNISDWVQNKSDSLEFHNANLHLSEIPNGQKWRHQ